MQSPHRTIVYIDGYNFYYGEVKGTQYKWLNLVDLFRSVLGAQNNLVKVKYFTARVQPTPYDPQINVRQETYLRALKTHCPLIEIYYGFFLRKKVKVMNINPPPPQVEGWTNEEKGSDVNLALQVLNDAWLDLYDCAVIVSNDSDLADSLRIVKNQHKKVIGLITPGARRGRNTSRNLDRYADFGKKVRTWGLIKNQLPNPIPGTKIHKPTSW